jgi:hypothetical protein
VADLVPNPNPYLYDKSDPHLDINHVKMVALDLRL